MGEGRADGICMGIPEAGGCLPAPPWVRAIHEGSLGYLQPRELASG